MSERTGDYQLRSAQQQVKEVEDVMRNNLQKVIDRGERLDDLNAKSEDLAFESKRFEDRSRRLKNQMWWQNKKFQLMIAGVILLIITIVVIVIATNV
eukprot:m.132946 g.132946  ORF g.132946 m.132946 type:complete len:97 (+) comp15789_c3_seq3:460-750(+)